MAVQPQNRMKVAYQPLAGSTVQRLLWWRGDASVQVRGVWASSGSSSLSSALCHDDRALVSENPAMKWLIGLLLILCVGLAGVYLYRTHVPRQEAQPPARQAQAAPAPTKESAPKKEEAAPERETRKELPLPNYRIILLPPPVARVRFGMTPEQVAARYPVVKRSAESGQVMLVHYLRPDRMQEARFLFEGGRLTRVEVVTRPRPGERLEYLRRNIESDYYKRYGRLPDSRRNRWSDAFTEAGVSDDGGVVTVYFKTKK